MACVWHFLLCFSWCFWNLKLKLIALSFSDSDCRILCQCRWGSVRFHGLESLSGFSTWIAGLKKKTSKVFLVPGQEKDAAESNVTRKQKHCRNPLCDPAFRSMPYPFNLFLVKIFFSNLHGETLRMSSVYKYRWVGRVLRSAPREVICSRLWNHVALIPHMFQWNSDVW